MGIFDDPRRLPDFPDGNHPSYRNINESAFQRIDQRQQEIERQQELQKQQQEQKEQKRDSLQERQTVASEKQGDYAKRSYPFVVYTAIIATIAVLPVVVQFLLWLLKLLTGCSAGS